MNHTPRNRTLLQVLVTAIVAVAMMAAFVAVGGMGSGVRGVIVFAQSTTMHSTSTCSQDDNNQGDDGSGTATPTTTTSKSTSTTGTTSTCAEDDNNQGDENEQGDDDCGTTT